MFSLDYIKQIISQMITEKLKELFNQKVEYSSTFGFELKRATDGSAAYDLCAGHSGCITPGQTSMVSTGIKMNLPENTAALVCSRSGLAVKASMAVLNAPGIVDSDFKQTINVILHNSDPVRNFNFDKGDRIAQIMIVHIPHYQLEMITEDKIHKETTRTGGFGSSGIK